MGCALSSPVELIRVQRHGSSDFRCAVAEMQGWRVGHEDAHEMRCEGSSALCFVLDGHGGDGAALYGAPDLVQELSGQFKGPQLPTDERIETSFAIADQHLRTHFAANPEKDSGSTVIGTAAAKQSDGTYSAKLINCGDSRGVLAWGPQHEEASSDKINLEIRRPNHLVALGVDGIGNPEKGAASEQDGGAVQTVSTWPVIVETVDHKPDHPTEKARILAGGGHVTEEDPPRLDGNLAVSRGLGDFEYKQDSAKPVPEQKVSAVPDVYEVSGLQPGMLCILGCDGVWDVMTAGFVSNFVRDWLRREPTADLGDIAADLVRLSLKKHSRDNVTVMILRFVDGSDWSSEPDEMKNYEKLSESADFDDDVRSHYATFLRRSKFALEPAPCDACRKWTADMKQCPCKQIHYCTRACQKKGWKAHKLVCPSGANSPSSSSPKGEK
mmetsp:Transcript_15805/g.28077  ORF Transcript_15805/g.28077 Transcript_15805/m.28077 type:complete len:440 (+) Transcript_15805:104-1423(+)